MMMREADVTRTAGAATAPSPAVLEWRRSASSEALAPELSSEASWRALYRAGGICCVALVAAMAVGGFAAVVWPAPQGAVAEWFSLFQRNALLGMLDLDLIMLVCNIALIPIVAAVCVAMRRTAPSTVVLGGALWGAGIVLYLGSSRIFEMLALSRQYTAAATASQRASLEAAAQTVLTEYLGSFAGPHVLAGWNYQGTAFTVAYVLSSVGGIIIGAAMLRTPAFGRRAGWIGIASFVAALGLFLPAIGVTLSLIAVLLQFFWYLVICRRLWALVSQREAAS